MTTTAPKSAEVIEKKRDALAKAVEQREAARKALQEASREAKLRSKEFLAAVADQMDLAEDVRRMIGAGRKGGRS